MKKILKITLISLISFILLIIIALTVLVNVVDPNQYKSEISQSVKDATGRQLSINGKIEWTLFPWLGLKINEVSFANAPGFGEKPLLSLDAANASIKLLPLLSKNIEIGTLILDKAKINLTRNSSGINNWDDLLKSNKNNTVTDTDSKNSYQDSKKNFSFSIDNIKITQAALSWDNQQNPQNFAVSDFDLLADNIRLDNTFPISIKAHILDKIKNVQIDFALSSKINISANFNNIDLEAIQLNLNNMILKGNFNLQRAKEKFNFKGDLNLPNFDLAKLITSLGETLPTTKSSNTFKKFSFNTSFTGTEQSLIINQLKAQLDDINLKGTASIRNFETPTIRFDLILDAINADNYMPPEQAKGAESPKAAKTQTTNEKNNPYVGLRSLDLEGKIAVNKLTAMQLTMTDASLALNAKNGLLQIQNLQARLYEGNTLSNVTYDVRTNTHKVSVKSSFNKVQIQPLMKDFMNKEVFSGAANITVDVNTQGATPDALTRSLNGNLDFAIEQGQINGIDLNYQITRAKALIAKKEAPAEASLNATRFDKLSATGRIINGILNNNDFILESSNILIARGMGTVDLPNQTISYVIKVKALEAGDLSKYEIPINIQGPFASPKITPDMTSILQQVAKQVLVQQADQIKTQLLSQLTSKNKDANTNRQQNNQGATPQDAIAQQGQKLLSGLFK